MNLVIPLLGFVLLGAGAMIYLTGLPSPGGKIPALGFEQITDIGARLACAACGAAPILMLSTAYAGFARLPVLLGLVVIPAYLAIAVIGRLLPDIGRDAGTGFLAGVVAVLVYDLMRLALSYSQGGGDPIPHIGVMLVGDGAPWWLGYLWRTFGNGAGLGVVYGVLMPRKWWRPLTGLGYASMIGLGMILVLWIFPQAQAQLFRLTWQTFVNSCLGHATYGLTLGWCCRKYREKTSRRRSAGRGRHARGVAPPTAPEAVTRPYTDPGPWS